MKTQHQIFSSVSREIAETNLLFLEMVKDGLTREELLKNIARRPGLWGRWESWVDKLPSKSV